MTNNRRSFIKQAAVLTGAFSATSLFNQAHAEDFKRAADKVAHLSPAQVAQDEDFWGVIQRSYTASGEIIILNNGGVSPPPIVVQQAVERYNQLSSQGPSYYMWRILDQGREPLRQKLAVVAGCDPEELAINRNATEALNSIILGLPLQKGDEVIGCKQDYPHMMGAYKQRAMRDGIVYKQLSFKFPIENDEEIVKAYADAITPKTKIIHVTHVVNWVGQIMPVRKIADMAHARGIEVICDGAHSFGLLDYKIPDLHCDYWGTSLHKFLSAPVGTGMMWVKKEKISKIWPLLSDDVPDSPNIRKFENLGTRSFALEQGIGEAVNFHNSIGNKRKEERVRYLKNYWAEKVQHLPGVKLQTSLKAEYSCGICGISIDGLTVPQLNDLLFTKYKIHTTGMVTDNVNSVRITPHVYTTIADLDKLVKAITEIAGSKPETAQKG